MDSKGWLLTQIEEVEILAKRMGHDGVSIGLRHALQICAEEAGLTEEKPRNEPPKAQSNLTK